MKAHEHHLKRSRGAWIFQRRVPTRHAALYPNQRIITKYLSTDRAAAMAARDRLLAATTQTFAALDKLSPRERDAIILAGGLDRWREAKLEREASLPFFDAVSAHLDDDPTDDVRSEDDLPDVMIAKAELVALSAHAAAKRARVEISAADELEAKLTSTPLLSLVDFYFDHHQTRDPKTPPRYRLYMQRFIDAVPNVAKLLPREVSIAHARAFRDALHRDADTTERNAAIMLSRLRTIWRLAVSEDQADTNPFEGVRAKSKPLKHDRPQPRAFSVAERDAIATALPSWPVEDQLMTRLMAYHGSRSGELMGVTTDHVFEVDGHLAIRFTDRDGASMKNKSSIRTIPVHPACVADLNRWVAGKAKGATLFTGRTDAMQSRIGRHLRALGMNSGEVSLHSWRHTWIKLARKAGVPIHVRKAITGHQPDRSDVHETYGGDVDFDDMVQGLAKIDLGAL